MRAGLALLACALACGGAGEGADAGSGGDADASPAAGGGSDAATDASTDAAIGAMPDPDYASWPIPEARDACAALGARLPTIRELQSMVDVEVTAA